MVLFNDTSSNRDRTRFFCQMCLKIHRTEVDPPGSTDPSVDAIMFPQDTFQFTAQSLFSDKIHDMGAKLANFYHDY